MHSYRERKREGQSDTLTWIELKSKRVRERQSDMIQRWRELKRKIVRERQRAVARKKAGEVIAKFHETREKK